MALTIILPDYLETKTEGVLFAALQDFGAERISATEWRFRLVPLTQQEFLAELKQFLPSSHHWLLERFKFKSVEKPPIPLIKTGIDTIPPRFGSA